jgi:hypothetical protein
MGEWEAAVDQDLVRGLAGAGIGGSRSQARSVSSDGRSRFWANLRTGRLVAVAPGFPRCRGNRAGRLLRDSGRSGSRRSKSQRLLLGANWRGLCFSTDRCSDLGSSTSGLRRRATVVRSRVGHALPAQSVDAVLVGVGVSRAGTDQTYVDGAYDRSAGRLGLVSGMGAGRPRWKPWA